MPGADDPKSDIRTLYLDALLHQPEVARLPFPERLDGIPFAELYVDQTVVEEQRERQPEPADAADMERALHAAMMREVVRQVDLWQALTERARVAVEAPASTGKSTLCRWVIHQLCQWITHQYYTRPAWLPIWIPFRDFAQSEKSLRQYLDEDYTAWLGLPEQPLTVELPDGSQEARTVGHWLNDEWQAGKALVILDGADEEFVPERRKQALDFVTLSQAARPRVLLTSRPLGASAPGFAQVQLQEFTPQQIDRLVRRCGVIMGVPDKAEQFLTAMQRTENLYVRPLAGRPGHLVQMFAAYVQDGVLLTSEEDLMLHVAERRLAITGRATPLPQPDEPSYKRQVVETLAFHLLFCRCGQAQNDVQMLSLMRQTLRDVNVNNIAVYAPRDGSTVLEDLCSNSGFLKQMRQSAYKAYEWESVLWLQFFAAAHLARKLGDNDPHFAQWVYAHRKNGQSTLQCPVCAMVLPPFSLYFWHGEWQDTITILAGLLDDATALLRRIQAEPHDIFYQRTNLAVRCLGRARGVAPKVVKQIINTAGHVWLQMLREHCPLDVTALRALTNRRYVQWTGRAYALMSLGLKDENRSVRQTAARALRQYSTPQTAAALCAALQDIDKDVRQAAVVALAHHSTPQTVAVLCTALQDMNEDVRCSAAWALGQCSSLKAATALHKALRDPSRWVRWIAAWALGRQSTPEAVAALCAAFPDIDEDVHKAAATVLGHDSTPEAVTVLCTALQDWRRDDVRWVAARALGQCSTPEAVFTLCAVYVDSIEDEDVALAAGTALREHATPEARAALSAVLFYVDMFREDVCRVAAELPILEAVAILSTALRDRGNKDGRWAAAAALGHRSAPEAVAALRAALQDMDWQVRWAAAAALGHHSCPDAVALLHTALQDPNRWVHWAAAVALGHHSCPEAVATLYAALQDTDKDIRKAAVEALGHYSCPEAVATLYAALQDTDKDIRKAAAKALGHHSCPDAVAALCAALQDEEMGVRSAVVRSLGKHSTLETVATLYAALQDKEPWVRLAAIEALGQHSTPKAVAALCEVLQDPNPGFREAAAVALGHHSTPQIVAPLCAVLQDKEPRVRLAAVAALGKHSTPKAVTSLCAALQDADKGVREAAAAALGQHSTPEAVAALCVALQDIDKDVRETAAEALEETRDTDAVSALLAAAKCQKQGNIWGALWRLSQKTKIWIDADGQWHPLPPVEPAFQNRTECQQVAPSEGRQTDYRPSA